MSILSSLNIAQQALLVNQSALSIVSNNIANIDTEGYSKQRVNLSPSVNFSPINGSVLSQINSASGVELNGVTRYTDTYLTSYYREQLSDNNYLSQLANSSSNIEGIMNELSGSGLSDALNSFYEAGQTLSSNPSSILARTNYIQEAQSVALKFNDLYDSLKDLRTSLVGDPANPDTLASSKIYTDTIKVNQKLEQITTINQQIIEINSGDMSPNSLLDQRDQLITELAELVPVSVTDNTNGSINLSINGINLIKGSELLGKLSLNIGDENTPVVIDVVKGNKVIAHNINSNIDTGDMGALLAVGGSGSTILTVKGTMDDLSDLANGFAQIMNDLQTQTNANGTPYSINKTTMQLNAVLPTDTIFTSSDGNPINAGNIQINSTIMSDPYKIAAARLTGSIDPLDPVNSANAIGNNSNMIAIMATRSGSYPELNNSSPEGCLSSIVGTIGLKVENTKADFKSQSAVLSQAKSQLNSATGVSMDEELIDLTKYQAAYQAAARVFSVCNSLLDTLINLGR